MQAIPDYYAESGNKRSVIWFIRHGESEANAGQATGRTQDIKLTEAGQRQAREIVKEFPYAPDLIVSSDYTRARETAEPTRLRFPNTRYEVWPVHEFTYLGSLHHIHSTKQERYAKVDAFWNRCNPAYQDGPGESFEQFLHRVQMTIERLKYRKEEFIAIFSHEQFIRAAQYLLDRQLVNSPESMKLFRERLLTSPLPNASILKKHLWKNETGRVVPESKRRIPRYFLLSPLRR